MEQATRVLLTEYCENYWDFGLGLSSDYLEFSDEKFDILLNVASNHDQAIKKCTQEQLVRFPLEIDFEVIVAHVVLQLSADLSVLFSGSALWALAFYVPLSGPLSRFEAELITAGLGEVQRQLLLIISSVALAIGVGIVFQLILSWALSPSWAASMGLLAVLATGFWTIASKQ